MGLETEGKKVMLQAFGDAAVKVDLHNASDQVLTGGGYSQQTISWTYKATGPILEADAVSGVVAEFSVPATTVKYVVFKNSVGTVMAKHDLGSGAETFANPGTFQLTAASLEIDPSQQGVICLKTEEKPKFKLTVKGRKVSKGKADVKVKSGTKQ